MVCIRGLIRPTYENLRQLLIIIEKIVVFIPNIVFMYFIDNEERDN